MGNRGRSAVSGPVVAHLVSAAVARLANRHPAVDEAVVHSVVYQAAVELVSTVTDPEQLRHMLVRRGHARLMAQAGTPIPITTVDTHG